MLICETIYEYEDQPHEFIARYEFMFYFPISEM